MEQYKHFLHDLVPLLKEKLEQSKIEQSKSNNDFQKGISMGYYETLDLIKSQAKAFGIPLEEIGLDKFDLEENL